MKLESTVNVICVTHGVNEIHNDRELLMSQLQILHHALPLPRR
jgi:hypothetical protein